MKCENLWSVPDEIKDQVVPAYAMSGSAIGMSRSSLRACYAMSGTSLRADTDMGARRYGGRGGGDAIRAGGRGDGDGERRDESVSDRRRGGGEDQSGTRADGGEGGGDCSRQADGWDRHCPLGHGAGFETARVRSRGAEGV
eukprot:3782754-Rhodomonas_salina.1